MRGTFSGFLDTSKHIIYFIEAANSGRAPLSFTGSVKADGELEGSFCAIDQSGQCIPNGVFGLWSVAPLKNNPAISTFPKTAILSWWVITRFPITLHEKS